MLFWPFQQKVKKVSASPRVKLINGKDKRERLKKMVDAEDITEGTNALEKEVRWRLHPTTGKVEYRETLVLKRRK